MRESKTPRIRNTETTKGQSNLYCEPLSKSSTLPRSEPTSEVWERVGNSLIAHDRGRQEPGTRTIERFRPSDHRLNLVLRFLPSGS